MRAATRTRASTSGVAGACMRPDQATNSLARTRRPSPGTSCRACHLICRAAHLGGTRDVQLLAVAADRCRGVAGYQHQGSAGLDRVFITGSPGCAWRTSSQREDRPGQDTSPASAAGGSCRTARPALTGPLVPAYRNTHELPRPPRCDQRYVERVVLPTVTTPNGMARPRPGSVPTRGRTRADDVCGARRAAQRARPAGKTSTQRARNQTGNSSSGPGNVPHRAQVARGPPSTTTYGD